MAPSSVAAASTAKLKLLSVASFGLLSGAGLLVGYYFLRKQRTTSTPPDSEGKSVETSKKSSTALEEPDVGSSATTTTSDTGNRHNGREEAVQVITSTTCSALPGTDSITKRQGVTERPPVESVHIGDGKFQSEPETSEPEVSKLKDKSVENSNYLLVKEDSQTSAVAGAAAAEIAAVQKKTDRTDAVDAVSVAEVGSAKTTSVIAAEEVNQKVQDAEIRKGKDEVRGEIVTEKEVAPENKTVAVCEKSTEKEPKNEDLRARKDVESTSDAKDQNTRPHDVIRNEEVNAATESNTTETLRERTETKEYEVVNAKEQKQEAQRQSKSHIPERVRRPLDATGDSRESTIRTVSSKGEAETTKSVTFRPMNAPFSRNGPEEVERLKREMETERKMDRNDVKAEIENSIRRDSESITSHNYIKQDSLSENVVGGTEPADGTLITKSTKSLLPLSPLTPPPEGKPSKRQRIRGGSQKTPATVVEDESKSSRYRWPPFDSANVEVDTSSQQALWKTNKPDDSLESSQSPWSSPQTVVEQNASNLGRSSEFDDNFVETKLSKMEEKTKSSNQTSELSVQIGVTKQLPLRSSTPECALERKPLIGEDDEDEQEEKADKILAADVSQKVDKDCHDDVTSTQVEAGNREDSKKLIEINQDCINSLIKLSGDEADTDMRLASLKALVNLSWTSEKHLEYTPVIGQLFANVDRHEFSLRLESLRVLANLSKNPNMVPHLLAAKAPSCLLKLLVPDMNDEVLVIWLSILDDILWTSKELCLTYASLPTEFRAASPETVYTGLYGLKNSRILKSRIFVLSRHKNQQVTYLASRIYSCLTS